MKRTIVDVLLWIAEHCYPHPINDESIKYDSISLMLQDCLNWWQKRQYRKLSLPIELQHIQRKTLKCCIICGLPITNHEFFKQEDDSGTVDQGCYYHNKCKPY